ncbi:MAG TPA: hypothetical protein VH120_14835 [Gemmataceae bacterium]|jgi:hypothetical protein|nr:hypothetical protein [Gemmataceae bacterium]
MKATIKLRPSITPVAAQVSASLADPRQSLDLHGFGLRWVAGESIRKLGREAGMEWNVLQGKLRILGYLRAPKRAQKGE